MLVLEVFIRVYNEGAFMTFCHGNHQLVTLRQRKSPCLICYVAGHAGKSLHDKPAI